MIPEREHIQHRSLFAQEALGREWERFVPHEVSIQEWFKENIHDDLFLNEFKPSLLLVQDVLRLSHGRREE